MESTDSHKLSASPEVKNQIEFEEGRRLTRYRCTAGHLTIGIGHNLDVKPFFNGKRIPRTIDDQLCDEIFDADLSDVISELSDRWSDFNSLDSARRDAVINMAFQLGTDGFMKFAKLRAALSDKDWGTAYQEAMDSKWARQTPNRAKRVAGQIKSGVYYPVPTA